MDAFRCDLRAAVVLSSPAVVGGSTGGPSRSRLVRTAVSSAAGNPVATPERPAFPMRAITRAYRSSRRSGRTERSPTACACRGTSRAGRFPSADRARIDPIASLLEVSGFARISTARPSPCAPPRATPVWPVRPSAGARGPTARRPRLPGRAVPRGLRRPRAHPDLERLRGSLLGLLPAVAVRRHGAFGGGRRATPRALPGSVRRRCRMRGSLGRREHVQSPQPRLLAGVGRGSLHVPDPSAEDRMTCRMTCR